jgi:hypothetical protein
VCRVSSFSFFVFVFVVLSASACNQKLLEMWAGYLVASLPDPGNQLCTDDFEGVRLVSPRSCVESSLGGGGVCAVRVRALTFIGVPA